MSIGGQQSSTRMACFALQFMAHLMETLFRIETLRQPFGLCLKISEFVSPTKSFLPCLGKEIRERTTTFARPNRRRPF